MVENDQNRFDGLNHKKENITKDVTSQYGNNPTYAFLRDASMNSIHENAEKSNALSENSSKNFSGSETRFERIGAGESDAEQVVKGVYLRTNAEKNHKKVYTRAESQKILRDIFGERMPLDAETVSKITGKSKSESKSKKLAFRAAESSLVGVGKDGADALSSDFSCTAVPTQQSSRFPLSFLPCTKKATRMPPYGLHGPPSGRRLFHKRTLPDLQKHIKRDRGIPRSQNLLRTPTG